VPLTALADQVWLCGSLPSSCGDVVIRACRNAGFEPAVGFESNDYHVMQGFIAAGLGVTLLPDLALQTLRSDLVVRATDPPAPKRRVWAATRSEGARSPATEEMISILVEVGASLEQRSAKRLELVA
jgi:DNA-binding transcriptional LysR family regulator